MTLFKEGAWLSDGITADRLANVASLQQHSRSTTGLASPPFPKEQCNRVSLNLISTPSTLSCYADRQLSVRTSWSCMQKRIMKILQMLKTCVQNVGECCCYKLITQTYVCFVDLQFKVQIQSLIILYASSEVLSFLVQLQEVIHVFTGFLKNLGLRCTLGSTSYIITNNCKRFHLIYDNTSPSEIIFIIIKNRI